MRHQHLNPTLEEAFPPSVRENALAHIAAVRARLCPPIRKQPAVAPVLITTPIAPPVVIPFPKRRQHPLDRRRYVTPLIVPTPLVEPIFWGVLRVEDIQRAVCEAFNMSRIDLLAHRRTKDVVYPRQLAMWLSKKLTTRSFPEIGRRFGGRDHTTVLHAVRKINYLAGCGQLILPADLQAFCDEQERRIADALEGKAG